MMNSDTESFHSAVDSLSDWEDTNTSDSNFKKSEEIVGERGAGAAENSEYELDGSNESEMLFMNRKKQVFEDRSFYEKSSKCKSVLEEENYDIESVDEVHFDPGRKNISIQELKVGDVPSGKAVDFQALQWPTSQLPKSRSDDESDKISEKNEKLFEMNVFKGEGVRKFGPDSDRKSEIESEGSRWGLTSEIMDEMCDTNMVQKVEWSEGKTIIDHEGWDDWELEHMEKHGNSSGIQNESRELPCMLASDKQNLIIAGSELKAGLGTKEVKTRKSFWNWTEFGDMVAAVGEGLTNISSVVESGLGLPTPEELVRDQSMERSANDSAKAMKERKEITNSSVKSYGVLFAGLGANVVTSSLDVLEALGKKTFEKLTVPEQGSEKRRFIFEPERGQNLSEVLRELRESRAEEAALEINCITKRELAFIDFFEKFSGMFHLEGFEMLSKTYLRKIPPQRRREVNKIFAEDLANTLEEYQDDKEETFVHNFKEILLAIALPYKGSGLVDSYTRCQERLEKLSDSSDQNFELFLECLADFTAQSVQSIHKLGQLLLITTTVVKQEPFSEFHRLIGRQISCFSNQFAQHMSAVGTSSKEIEELVTAVFLAAGDSFSYIQQSFRLLRPLLLVRQTMFGVLKKVRDMSAAQYCDAVVNACRRAAAIVHSSEPDKVEAINASTLKTFKKCDGSYMFALYIDKPKDGIYYVVYVPRMLKVWRTQNRGEAELLRDQLNNLEQLVNILEKISSKLFEVELERLRDSVIKHPNFNDIHHAAVCDFPKVIVELCKDHPNMVNEKSADGYYPLHTAVENNAKEAVQVLLSLGAHTAKQDSHSRSAIHYGAENNPEILELLARAHDFFDAIDMIDEDGLSPLCLAICSAKEKSVELLLDADCSTGPFPGGSLAAMISIAASSPSLPRIVDLLLTRAPQFLVEEVDDSSTILHKKLELKLLYHILGDFDNVVNVNVRNNSGETPLYCAVTRNDLTQSFVLITYNADVNIANCEGDTPLHVSAKNGDVDLVKLLLCFGASVQLKNDRGETALDVGSGTEIMECLKLFAHPPTVTPPFIDNVLSDFMQERALKERYQMEPEQRQRLVNVMSFDGGGIRGLILLQTLVHIEKLLGHSIIEHFHWLCGTSVGAIIALGLAKGYSLKHCQNLCLRMKDELFNGRRPYSEKVFEGFLCETFGEKTTMSQLGSKKIIVTASCVQKNPPLLKLFRSYTLPVSEAENKAFGFDDPCKSLVWKCARYSSAAPMLFTPKDNFIDGGLISNNPTLDLLSDIHTYNAACIRAKKEIVHIGCIMSLGTGQAPSEELGKMRWNFGIPEGLVEGVSMFQDLMTWKNIVEQIISSNGPCVTRARSWAHDKSIPFFRFSPSLSSRVKPDESNNKVIVGFLWDAEKYLRTNGRHDVETLTKYLKSL